MSGKAPTPQSLAPTSGPSMAVEDGSHSQRHLSAQRAARCMQLLLEMIVKCRVSPALHISSLRMRLFD